MPNVASICIHNEQNIVSDGAYSLNAHFAVVATFIPPFHRKAVENARRIVEPEATLFERPLALGLISFEYHNTL